jgi:hypothetical protein
MPTVYLCHAPSDAETAGELAAFLECGTGARTFVAEARIEPGQDLIARVNDGRMADVVLVLLSPDAVPPRWKLEEWQDAFWHKPEEEGVALAAVLVRGCRFPELLRRKNFFELGPQRLEVFRAIKRWVIGLGAPEPGFFPAAPMLAPPDTEIEILATALADRPGLAVTPDSTTALAFAARHGGEFEAVLWAAAGAGDVALTGDLAAQAGFAADAPHDDNLRRLQRLCADHRLLVILDGAGEDRLGLFQAGGLTSVVAPQRPALPAPAGLEGDSAHLLDALAACGPVCSAAMASNVAGFDGTRAEETFAALEARGLALRADARTPRWRNLCDAAPSHALGVRHASLAGRGDELAAARHAFAWCRRAGESALACETGRRAFSLASQANRFAEAFELLESLGHDADPETAQYCLREQCRILDRWEMFEESAQLRRESGAYCGVQEGFAF